MKKYSKIHALPTGHASDNIVQGCLVLEGGAFRGVYGEGACDALMEADLNFETTIGISAGALNGISYLSGQIGRTGRINLGSRLDKIMLDSDHGEKRAASSVSIIYLVH